ncbi:MAG: alpha/beta hydrolase fold domain-containing protein, partial [Rhodopseudomonas sp.]|nr:alpha/beta hydrolase fold domain-containing protein [Rhodopseudomonas sp.]
MVGIVNRLSNRFVHRVGSFGLAAAAVLALSVATAPRAQALSPIGTPATSAAKVATDHTIQIQNGRPLGAGGFRGGGGGFHGGGFQVGSLASHRELMAQVSAAASARVFGVAYRLAPEHRFPAALD